MEDILVKIVANTRKELVARKKHAPLERLKEAVADAPPARDFATALLAKSPVAVIAEVKRASPSKGVIRKDFDPVAIAKEYASAGAAALSVLTDAKFFQGSLDDLRAVRSGVELPVLRKDFIVDSYQLYEARAAGADCALLISEILTPGELKAFHEEATALGMQVLVESHDRENLDAALASGARLIGINNRNLRTFRVELRNTERLAPLVARDRIVVSESGIASGDDVRRLAAAGVKAILVGETLLTADDIAAKMKELLT